MISQPQRSAMRDIQTLADGDGWATGKALASKGVNLSTLKSLHAKGMITPMQNSPHGACRYRLTNIGRNALGDQP